MLKLESLQIETVCWFCSIFPVITTSPFVLRHSVSVNRAGCWYVSQTDRHMFTTQTHTAQAFVCMCCTTVGSWLGEGKVDRQVDRPITRLTAIPPSIQRAGLAQ